MRSLEELQAEAAARQAPFVTASGGVKRLWSAGWENAAGGLGVVRTRGSLSLGLPFGDTALTARAFGRRYDFDLGGDTPFGPDPWADVDIEGLSLSVWQRLHPRWSLSSSLSFSQAGEDGSRLDDTSWSLLGLGSWSATDDLTVFVGAFHLFGIEEDLTAPVLGVDWDLAEKLGLTSDEEGTRLEFRPADDWRIDLGFDADVFQARLGAAAAEPDGVLQYFEFDLGLRALWRPEFGRQVSFGVLSSLFLDLELQDRDGGFRGSERLDPGVVVFLELEYRF